MIPDIDAMKNAMVEEQLIGRGISDKKVLDAFRKVPRHEFVAKEFLKGAYGDYPLPINDNQTISQPYMVALMTEALKLKGHEKILEIGTGSGYQAAILAELAGEVYSVERFRGLADAAISLLTKLEYKNVHIRVGDGTLGWEEFAPYDGIIVTAGSPSIPASLVRQLKNGGRLLIPVGSGSLGQMLTLLDKAGDNVRTSHICGCTFVPLIGKEGWSE